MHKRQSLVVDRLTVSIEELHQAFGAWNIALALFRAIRKQSWTTNQISHLSDRMLRDLGLPERKEDPVERFVLPWKTWF